jgi:PAS domain S-box-containing protein
VNQAVCSVRSLILAPTGRDAPLIVSLLAELGVVGDTCEDIGALARQLQQGAGLAIIADEALKAVNLRPLLEFLENQGAWSDLPIILLTHSGELPAQDPELQQLSQFLGNVNFLERPFHPATLASMVRAAVRNRHRQYEARARHQEIIEREQQLQTALTAGHLGAWTLDVDSRQLQASESSRAHFGRERESPFSYDDLLAAIHPEDREERQIAFAEALKAGTDYTSEFRNIWPDASVHWVDIRARTVRDDTGRVTQLIGVSADITARKVAELERERLLAELASEKNALSRLTRHLEERVDERTAQLTAEIAAREKTQMQLLQSQKMESIGQLTGGIAHDFNNLLMAVMGSLEILRKRLPPDPGLRRLLDGATQAAVRGASLTQRMLTFARQQELKTSAVDLNSLLVGMQELLHRSIGPHIDLRIHVKADLPCAEADANQLELSVLNLAINARDAMPDGGAISIDIDDEEIASNHGQGLKPGQYLRIKIADTGCGMDAPTLAKAIEPFFSTKPAGKGTGLGLSMTHGLTRQLGGALHLSSEVGKGTLVTLWLPVARSVSTPLENLPPRTSLNRSIRILVVDDDPLVATSTVDMLEDLGHSVISANSGKHALEILETGQPIEILVTDHAMPGMTGAELAKLAVAKRPGLPVLLVTGYADLPASVLTHMPRLSKPFQQAQLQDAINTLID